METDDGYRIIQGSGEWYYYAALDADGEFTPTSSRVGIDPPPAGSYKLERSASRIALINQQIAEFNAQIQLNAQWFAQKQAIAKVQGLPVTLRIGVILVEFQDVRHYRDTTNPDLYYGYRKASFDSMLFSSCGFWFDTTTVDGTPHPENEKIFGSFRDYYWQMSQPNGPVGALVVTGTVVNPPDENSVPRWIRLDSAVAFYQGQPMGNNVRIFQEAYQKARDSGWISDGMYDRVAVVYAQEVRPGGLWPHAFRLSPSPNVPPGWLMAEQFFNTFAHIGAHAHEFGHTVGFFDEYGGPTPLGHYDLMALGSYNGPLGKGECPATLSPYYRVSKGWVTPIDVSSDLTDLIVEYNYTRPIFYKIRPPEANETEYFLFETRLRDGFDQYTPNH